MTNDAVLERVKDEFRRQRRLVDQNLSMHSYLRDRLSTRARLLSLSILLLSFGAAALAFTGHSRVTVLGVTTDRLTWVGWVAIAAFALALVELLVDWRGRAWGHGEAVRRLAELKARYRTATEDEPNFPKNAADLTTEYVKVTESLPPISERIFNRLKAKHLRKVCLSRAIDSADGLPYWRIRLRYLARGVKHGIKS